MSTSNAQKKYDDVIAKIKILARRAYYENKLTLRMKLEDIIKYLEKVREQRHLAMIGEKDREEKVRYYEILEYIDREYDGTNESIKRISITINNREDQREVLEKNKNGEER